MLHDSNIDKKETAKSPVLLEDMSFENLNSTEDTREVQGWSMVQNCGVAGVAAAL